MNIVLAPDSFKGCLTSPQVCAALARGLARTLPAATVVSVPLADGGEGTTRAVVAATGGTLHTHAVHGPLMETVPAEWGLLGGDGRAGVMEMATASGLELLEPRQRDPLKTTTYGTGQLLAHLLGQPLDELLVGIGGSATVDGGAGFLQALGYVLLDRHGTPLPPGAGGGDLGRIERVDAGNRHPGLARVRLRVACDVTNPLTGPNGAAAVFGPQKGADAEAVVLLDRHLGHWRDVLVRSGLADGVDRPGDGAAGGLGFALRAVCGARMASGAELVMELAGLEKRLAGATLLVTGEGRTDAQTAGGKLCAAAAGLAARNGVPTVLVSGAVTPGHGLEDRFAATFSIARGPGALEDAIVRAGENLEIAGANVGALLAIGRGG